MDEFCVSGQHTENVVDKRTVVAADMPFGHVPDVGHGGAVAFAVLVIVNGNFLAFGKPDCPFCFGLVLVALGRVSEGYYKVGVADFDGGKVSAAL